MIGRTAIAGVALVLSGMSAAWFCQVPVFRYALERWEPDAYEVLIVSDGELSEKHSQLLQQLAPDPVSGSPVANLRVRRVYGSTEDSRRLVDEWKVAHPDSKLPQIVVRSPDIKQQQPIIWSAPLSQENLDQLVDSNIRQQVAEELIDGTSAVWLLLLSGNEAADKAAKDTLQKRLEYNEANLKLSMPDAQDIADGFDPNKLKLRFKLLTVSRTDVEESFFTQSLMHVEPDLMGDEYAGQPLAFPVFGRGRALYALIGEGIANDVIDDACRFLIGPCSCQVKDQNPGVDLLLAVDWDSLVETSINTDVELPPLMGLSQFGKPKTESVNDAEPTGVVVERKDSQEVAALEPTASKVSPAEATPPAPDVAAPQAAEQPTDIWLILLGVGGVGILGILALTLMIMKQ